MGRQRWKSLYSGTMGWQCEYLKDTRNKTLSKRGDIVGSTRADGCGTKRHEGEYIGLS